MQRSRGEVERETIQGTDIAFLELLYGCGIRVGELVGINLEDIDLGEGWLRVRGKGNKERQVPIQGGPRGRSSVILRCECRQQERALFLNRAGGDWAIGGPAAGETYALVTTGDSTVHPHSFRHAYATHLRTARIYGPFRNCWDMPGFRPLRNTHKSRSRI